MKKHTRLLAWLLVFVLLLGNLPLSAMAAETEPPMTEAPTQPAAEPVPETEPAAEEPSEPPPEEAAPATDPAPEETIPEESVPETDPTEPAEAGQPTEPETPIVEPMEPPEEVMPLASGVSLQKGDLFDFGSYVTVFNTKGETSRIYGYHPMTLDGKVAYCIDPPASTGSGYNENFDGDAAWQSLSYKQKTAIALILAYGYPNNQALVNSSDSANTIACKTVATQFLIWEIIMGYRNASIPFTRTNSALYDCVISGNQSKFRSAYNTIAGYLENHTTIPSFTSPFPSTAPTITLKYNQASGKFVATVTDTNGVLSDYPFTSTVSGVTFTPNGNTLTITATADAAKKLDGAVVASATGHSVAVDPALVVAVWSSASGGQSVCTVNSAPDPAKAYFKLAAEMAGTGAIQKTSDSGDVADYCFKIYRWGSNTSWYGKTDSSGKVYLTDSGYNQSGTKSYTFEGMLDGEYSFLEVLSRKGAGHVFPDSWRIAVTDTTGQTVYDKTFTAADFTADDNGDCRLAGVSITGLTGGGKMTMTIHNAPVLADLEIAKTSEDGKVEGIDFTLEEFVPGLGYFRIGQYTTDQDGKISVPKLSVGTTYRITEIVPAGYIGEAPKEITICEGTNTVTFENRPIYGSIELTKIDADYPDNKLTGAEFTVTYPDGSAAILPEVPDADGNGTGVYRLEHLPYGSYTVRETKAPAGYELSDTVYEVDITEEKTYLVQSEGLAGVANQALPGSIAVKKVDPAGKLLAGVSFLLEYSTDSGASWQPVTFRAEDAPITAGGCASEGLTDGVLVTGEDGMALFSGLRINGPDGEPILYRLTETAALPGYVLLTEPVFEGSLTPDDSNIAFTCVNGQEFQMPFTGGAGLTTVPMGVCLIGLALCAAVLFSRKKKEA